MLHYCGSSPILESCVNPPWFAQASTKQIDLGGILGTWEWSFAPVSTLSWCYFRLTRFFASSHFSEQQIESMIWNELLKDFEADPTRVRHI